MDDRDTEPVRGDEVLDARALDAYLRPRLPDVTGELEIEQFPGGHSNLTYLLRWSDHEYLQAKHMQETFRSIIAEMGGTPTSPMPAKEQDYGLAVGGLIIHEAGATRMGSDAKTSVLNKNCQAHDAKNVFICDPFVSQANKNLTWTIMALAWRTSEHIAEERKKGNI